MARNVFHECQNCHKKFENGWTAAKYCSAACKQQAYRNRKATVTQKSQPGRCIRCNMSAPKGSRYCSATCKVRTNLEKHAETYRLFKAIFGGEDYDVFTYLESNWKEAYKTLEGRGYVYSAYDRAWHDKRNELELFPTKDL